MISPALRRKTAASIALIRKVEPLALEMSPETSLWLGFSGGKDSQALYQLALEAGVRFKAFMSLTSVDPPEVIRFVKRNYPSVTLIKPKESIYAATLRHRMLPTMRIRWCCEEFKENASAGTVTLVGVRRQESSRRAKRQEVEMMGHKYAGAIDQFVTDRKAELLTCIKGRDKVVVSPLLEWTERDVWEFLASRGLPHCTLYDEGWKRIGYVLCPMSRQRGQKEREMKRWPHVRRNWLKTIDEMIRWGYITRSFKDAETGFRWWISHKSWPQFYVDEFLQKKIEFEEQPENE